MSQPRVEKRDAHAAPAAHAESAARALDALKGVAADDALALITAEAERCRDAARQALGSLKETLAALERSYEETVAANGAPRQSSVGTFVERLVTGATAASEAAAERARAEVGLELDRVQAALDEVRKELASERERAAAVRAQLETEQTARAAAEAAAAEAERRAAELVSAQESEQQALRAEIATLQAETARLQKQVAQEKAARARLLSAIQEVVEPADTAEPPGDVKTVAEAKPGPAPKAESKPARKGSPSPETPPAPTPEAPPEVVAYVQHLFTTLEAMYSADVAAGRKPDDLLNRLTQNLRSARNVFRNHIGAADGTELPLFDQQLAELLANPEESAFCRHLGIAAYECTKPDAR